MQLLIWMDHNWLTHFSILGENNYSDMQIIKWQQVLTCWPNEMDSLWRFIFKCKPEEADAGIAFRYPQQMELTPSRSHCSTSPATLWATHK